MWMRLKLNKTSYLMLAPFMILFFLFTGLPVLISIILSFTSFNMLEFPRWVGWMNYTRLFLDDDVFLIAVKNTLVFAFITGPLSYLLSLMLAWFIHELPRKLRAFMTLLIYAPSISGGAYFIWLYLFSGDAYGLINGSLIKWSILQEPVNWLLDGRYNMKVLILVQLWVSMGAGFLAFIAGYQSVDHELYSAGAIDGVRNRWQELWYITLPSIAPQMVFAAVLQIAATFAVSDVSINLAGFPSTNYSAHTVVIHMIDYGTVRYEMGYASSIAVVLVVAMILTNNVMRYYLKKVVD